MDKPRTRQDEVQPAVPDRIQNLKPLERIQRVLKGEPVDRPAFCLYTRYALELLGGAVLAHAV